MLHPIDRLFDRLFERLLELPSIPSVVQELIAATTSSSHR